MSLFFCCCLCLKGRSQGAGGEPCCSAWSLCKEETVGHKGFLFPLPPTYNCVCTTQNKSIQLFASCSVCNASSPMSVLICTRALQLPSPWGTVLCTQQCIHTWVAHVWCLVWHVQKAHFSECLSGLGGFLQS